MTQTPPSQGDRPHKPERQTSLGDRARRILPSLRTMETADIIAKNSSGPPSWAFSLLISLTAFVPAATGKKTLLASTAGGC